MFISQLPSNICTFPFRCLSENSENQSRIKNFVVLHSLTWNGNFVFTFLLLKVAFTSITSSPRRRRFVFLLVEVSCWQRLGYYFVTSSVWFVWIPSVSDWGPLSRNATILLQHFVQGMALNLFSLWSKSAAEIGDDSTSSRNKINLFEPLQFMVDISRL